MWVIVGNVPVRDRASAEYALTWIDRLQKLADASPGWRSPKEKDHVYGQFEEARQILRRPSSEIEAILGYVDEPELIHRDNLVLL